MLAAKVKITRFVDDVQPGIVECELTDASGNIHRFVDKVPIFSRDFLGENSPYPIDGTINFQIVKTGAEKSLITTELPWHVESVEGKTEFEISNTVIQVVPPHRAEVIAVQVGNSDYLSPGNYWIDISIPLKFHGSQPNAYGVERASSEVCRSGEIVGDTRRGGSVNFERYTLIPHCNGTHTECVGHITNERISVGECLHDVLIPTVLISVEPEHRGDSDHLITRSVIESAISDPEAYLVNRGALIVRTIPNDDSKLTRQYGSDIPPYFTAEAMYYIVECGFKHLLVDMPSIDRIFDEGKLINHRIFWSVESGSFEINPKTRTKSTITELIYVPNSVTDGEYLLNLQIAPFEADASPSRPVIFKLQH